jgi:hypothetical protein
MTLTKNGNSLQIFTKILRYEILKTKRFSAVLELLPKRQIGERTSYVKSRILNKMNKRSARSDVNKLLSHLFIHFSVSATDAL